MSQKALLAYRRLTIARRLGCCVLWTVFVACSSPANPELAGAVSQDADTVERVNQQSGGAGEDFFDGPESDQEKKSGVAAADPQPDAGARTPGGSSGTPGTTSGAPPPISAPPAQSSALAGAVLVVPPGAEEAVKVFPMIKDEWRMWGGNAGRNMVNPFAKNIPHEWDINTGKNIKWVAQLGSQSYGNPVIAEGRILVGTNNELERNPKIEGDKGVIMCFNEDDGRFLWQVTHDKLSAGRVNDWPEQGICSTPVVEDGRFYYVSNRCELVCADLDGFADGNDGPYKGEKYTTPIDGDFIWVYDMMEELRAFPHNLATSSPVVVNDIVFVLTGNGGERDHITIPSPRSPSFVAVNKKTGELVWYSAEPGENILHGQWSCAAYGVGGGTPQVVFPGGDGWLYSFNPTGDAQGKAQLIWKFDCNPKDSKWELGGLGTRNNLISTPVFYGDSVYISVGQDPEHGEGVGHLYRIRSDGQGDVTGSKQVWHFGGTSDGFRRSMSSVAIHEGLVYITDLSGFLYCLDMEKGTEYWVHDTLAAVWGSPTVIDGKVFLGDEDGDLFICRTGKKLVPVAEINMEDSVYTTPVAVKGVLYIATRTHLYAIAEKD